MNFYYSGWNKLQIDSTKNYDDYSIQELCTLQDSSFNLILFEEYEGIMPILEDFRSLFGKHDNDFVRYFLYSILRDTVKKQNITYANFVPLIWDPFFMKCCELLTDIKDRSIKLREIHRIENDCTKSDLLESQLLLLCCGLEGCKKYESSGNSHHWISVSVKQIKTYLSMCDQAKAADIVLQLRKKLKLSGNFDIVEYVAHKVSETMEDQALSSIDVSIDALASFLQDMASDGEKRYCIEMFSNCLDIVDWIKNGNTTVIIKNN